MFIVFVFSVGLQSTLYVYCFALFNPVSANNASFLSRQTYTYSLRFPIANGSSQRAQSHIFSRPYRRRLGVNSRSIHIHHDGVRRHLDCFLFKLPSPGYEPKTFRPRDYCTQKLLQPSDISLGQWFTTFFDSLTRGALLETFSIPELLRS